MEAVVSRSVPMLLSQSSANSLADMAVCAATLWSKSFSHVVDQFADGLISVRWDRWRILKGQISLQPYPGICWESRQQWVGMRRYLTLKLLPDRSDGNLRFLQGNVLARGRISSVGVMTSLASVFRILSLWNGKGNQFAVCTSLGLCFPISPFISKH